MIAQRNADAFNFSSMSKLGIGIPFLVLMIIGMMILPIPPLLLDILFTFNISLSLIVLLAGVYSKKPLDFASFPTVLLLTTLLRLSLNVASARAVLLNGHLGTASAGHVIESFGKVVIGGNYAVGIVVFMILVIINFVVITKGSGRVSEVSARFILDAMPGKQMSIDADLNAGIIKQEEAKRRRQEVAKEADFYGSMDGASKFVRGDAIAGILILIINLLGGLMIGMIQHGLDFSNAARLYALLTIGDGLVAQLPALLLSTAAAILVTRVSSDQDMDSQLGHQLFADIRSLFITSGVLLFLGIIPGMPHVSFLLLGTLIGGAGYLLREKKNKEMDKIKSLDDSQEMIQEENKEDKKELTWDDVSSIDVIGLELGYRLIPLVDKEQGGALMDRIKGVRKMLSQEFGFLFPTVHIRDNLDLNPNAYRIVLLGVPLSEFTLYLDKLLAINPGQVFGSVQGIETKEPAFGMDAIWIEANQRSQAQSMGYTVADPTTILATHLSHIMKEHVSELFGHEEGQQLLDRLSAQSPKLAETLVPNLLPLSQFVKILQNLLREKVSIKDIRTISETLADHASKTREIEALTAAVRVSLGRQIISSIAGNEKELPVITLSSELEQILQKGVQIGNDSSAAIEPKLAQKIQQSVYELAQKQDMLGQPSILLVSGSVRTLLSRFLRGSVSGLNIISYQEIPDYKNIKIISTIG